MAYYNDGYTWAQEHTTYSHVAYQDPVSFLGYEPYSVDTNCDAYNVSQFHGPKSIDHSDYGYGYDYDNDYDYGNCHNWYSSTNPSINYFEHNYIEPKLIAYEPIKCDTGYVSYHTQYAISYSQVNSAFNEPEFDEYDPTPYGGGYDIISTYGKPIPPSDQTCYPRSKPKPIGPRLTPLPNLEPKHETKPEPKPVPVPMSIATPTILVEPETQPKPKPEPQPDHALVPVPDPLKLKEFGGREREEYSYPNYGYDYAWPEYDHANATRVGYDYGYGKQVVQIPPCEYSPEVVDLCESIFGNWPCLARIRKQQMVIDNNNAGQTGPEIGHHNPWEECASYFFGRPLASYNG